LNVAVMDLRRLWAAGVLVLLACGCDRGVEEPGRVGAMEPAAYWVWHRSSPLAERELQDLRRAGTKMLGWQVAEMGWEGGRWQVVRVSAWQPEGEGLEVFPVVRIKPGVEFLSERRAARELAGWLREWAGGSGLPGQVQLDFDCPARLLPAYAGFLRDFRLELGGVGLSVTALASWIGQPGFGKVAGQVDWIAPMFYDLEIDEAPAVVEGRFRPMVDGVEWVRRWRSCRVPWRAGLPNFERVSVFSAAGELRGHLRGWSHDAVFFQPDLVADQIQAGVTLFRAQRELELSGTRVSPEDLVVHRMPDGVALREMEEAARESGARGVVYFALPGPGLQAAYSPRHLAAAEGTPVLRLELLPDGAVVLRNLGERDLPARAGGWELHLAGERAGAFRSAGPGGFVRLSMADGSPAEGAVELRLHFSRLPAGTAVESGPLVENPARLRWRVAGLDEVWMPPGGG
jgi:hypothetical protein